MFERPPLVYSGTSGVAGVSGRWLCVTPVGIGLAKRQYAVSIGRRFIEFQGPFYSSQRACRYFGTIQSPGRSFRETATSGFSLVRFLLRRVDTCYRSNFSPALAPSASSTHSPNYRARSGPSRVSENAPLPMALPVSRRSRAAARAVLLEVERLQVDGGDRSRTDA